MDYSHALEEDREKLEKLTQWLHNHKNIPVEIELYNNDDNGHFEKAELTYQLKDGKDIFQYYYKDSMIEYDLPFLYEVWESQLSCFKRWGSKQLNLEP